jgi:membrane protease YdiL (CAAX protease family)
VPDLVDHVLVFAFAAVYPLYGPFVSLPRLKRAIESGVPGMRLRAYYGTIVGQWLLAVLALTVWLQAARPLPELGLALRFGWRFWVGLVIALAAMVAMARQARRLLGDTSKQGSLRHMLERVLFLLPHTPEELRTFRALSVTAGICEEILFRGYLIWYLSWLMGLWPAVLVSSLLFGLAHSYQGASGILRTVLAGLLFALLYLLTRSLWIPMLLHAFIDINSGRAAYALTQTPEEEREPTPAA